MPATKCCPFRVQACEALDRMSIVCTCKLIFTHFVLFAIHDIAEVTVARGRLSCHRCQHCAVNGLSSLLLANQIARIRSRELYLVLWVFIYVALQTPTGSCNVRWNQHGRFFRASLQGIPLLRLFFLIFLYTLGFRSLLTRANAWKRRWIRTNKLMLAHTLWEWNFPHCGIILKLNVLGILRVVVSVGIFFFKTLVMLSVKYSEELACRSGAKE